LPDSRDAQLEQRFDSLLQKYVPSKTSPIVFFDHLGPKGWLAVNAALRAKALGYSNIYWYRGGLPSWTAAKLPRPPQQLQSVVH
jgi:rhodanese-related sulfurtransferase